jgi:hypothetical protein
LLSRLEFAAKQPPKETYDQSNVAIQSGTITMGIVASAIELGKRIETLDTFWLWQNH